MDKEYIERKALLKTLNKEGIPYNGDVNYFIMNAPTADVVEVKHGCWEWFAHNSKTRTCSVCHISQTVNVYKNKVMFNYCPYCGAKMDGANEKS